MSLGQEEHGGSPPTAEGHVADESPPASVGEYTWADFFDEFDPDAEHRPMDEGIEWDTELDLGALLGCPPSGLQETVDDLKERARTLDSITYDTFDPDETPVRQGIWTWHHYVREFVDPDWEETHLPEEFDTEEHLGFPEESLGELLAAGNRAADVMPEIVEERTVNVNPEIDESEFFTTVDGKTTIANRYDLEKAVPLEKKLHFRELERYWVNKPYAFVTIFRSEKENETKYYLVEPYQTEVEEDLFEFLTEKLRTSIKYTDELVLDGDEEDRREVLERETKDLLERYDIHDGLLDPVEGEECGRLNDLLNRVQSIFGSDTEDEDDGRIPGIGARPEPAVLEEDAATLTTYQVEKLMYRLRRNFLGYERIDGIKHDINVEDISCDGYNSPVFVYHSSYEQIISNVFHGKERLDDFVVKLAQRSGKGISKRQPQVDATLPDGSRAQLTLGKEVSDHGTNYTIRQFNDVPFTPIDLINWRTFSLEEMAFLWLCIENHKSLIFAGGTASGKTTSLNAVSLFIPSNSKIVSIEDTREVELPQRNWIASVTRPSFSDDEKGDVDEFDLLEAALRQRPEYIVMGEIRGEEGRTLFQVMSTGHTTYTTFHADSVGEVLKRFTTDPINVSKTMFTALDLVSIQTSTRVQGKKVRRNKSLTEINHYDTENDEINVQDIYQWQAETDEFLRIGQSNTLDDILFDRGWDQERLDDEISKRETILAYLIQNGLKEYRQVAATLQAFITDPDTILALMANDRLESSLEDLREMESVSINVDPEKEELVPRPDPDEAMREHTEEILERAGSELFPEYEDEVAEDLDTVLAESVEATDVVASPGAGEELSEQIAEAEDDGEDEEDELDREIDPEPAVDEDEPRTEEGEPDDISPNDEADDVPFDPFGGHDRPEASASVESEDDGVNDDESGPWETETIQRIGDDPDEVIDTQETADDQNPFDNPERDRHSPDRDEASPDTPLEIGNTEGQEIDETPTDAIDRWIAPDVTDESDTVEESSDPLDRSPFDRPTQRDDDFTPRPDSNAPPGPDEYTHTSDEHTNDEENAHEDVSGSRSRDLPGHDSPTRETDEDDSFSDSEEPFPGEQIEGASDHARDLRNLFEDIDSPDSDDSDESTEDDDSGWDSL